ncbi:MAG: biotin--[acetyl-CoA-carboxylase] ligase [Candidatus Methanofastidiosia archaeon]
MGEKILKFLIDSRNQFVSGEFIANGLGISRQTVSKRIAILRKRGFEIISRTNRGYRLVNFPDVIVKEYIMQKTGFWPIYHFDRLDSTNTHAWRLALDGAGEKTLVVSEVQDAGRGRMGREWLSPPGGLWFSFVLKPKCSPSLATILNFVAANAISKSLKSIYNIDAKMKWPNDIFVQNKKLCGILVLVSSDTDVIHYLIVGIGINANNDAKGIDNATSLKEVLGRKVDRNTFLVSVLNNFEEEYKLFEKEEFEDIILYSRSISNTIGRFVKVSYLGRDVVGRAVDIKLNGALEVEVGGKIEEVLAGDIEFLRHL